MADIQVPSNLLSKKELSKSKITSSSTAKSCSQKRPAPVSDTTRTSDSASKLPKKLLSQTILTKNVPSLLKSLLEEKSWRESSFPPRCNALLLSDVITFTTFLNTTDTRRDTETSPLTFPLLSQSKKVTSSSSENADPSPKPSTSTSLKSPPTKSSETSENSSCSFDSVYLITLLLPKLSIALEVM